MSKLSHSNQETMDIMEATRIMNSQLDAPEDAIIKAREILLERAKQDFLDKFKQAKEDEEWRRVKREIRAQSEVNDADEGDALSIY